MRNFCDIYFIMYFKDKDIKIIVKFQMIIIMISSLEELMNLKHFNI